MSEEISIMLEGLAESFAEQAKEKDLKIGELQTYFWEAISNLKEILKDNQNASKIFEDLILCVLKKEDTISTAVSKHAFLQGICFSNNIRNIN